MERFTSNEKRIIDVILGEMFKSINIEDNQSGIFISLIDGHKVYLMIDDRSNFYADLKSYLKYKTRNDADEAWYDTIKKLGYVDCISSLDDPAPVIDSIFVREGCKISTQGSVITVSVESIFVDFANVRRTIRKINEAKYHNYSVDFRRLKSRIREDIICGKYDIFKDEI